MSDISPLDAAQPGRPGDVVSVDREFFALLLRSARYARVFFQPGLPSRSFVSEDHRLAFMAHVALDRRIMANRNDPGIPQLTREELELDEAEIASLFGPKT